MVDVTTIEPNSLPKPMVALIENNRSLIGKNQQLKYFATALLVIAILATTYIQVTNQKKENGNY